MNKCFWFTIIGIVLMNTLLMFTRQVKSTPMPIVAEDPYCHLKSGGIPIANRDSKYRTWNSATVRIETSKGGGSGTIIYYDSKTNTAYVQSCGHLWEGEMSASSKRNITCKIVTWFHNDLKLFAPKEYVAKVIYYSNAENQDCSLLKFTPDWKPNYFPIAQEQYTYLINSRLYSTGCDGGTEAATYNVRVIGEDSSNVITTENSPRPGRSGGGLFSNGYFVGICWGTTEEKGTGNGYFTSLKVLRKLNSINGYGFLNEVSIEYPNKIPIIDRNGPQRKYSDHYIPVPIR